ncbi:MAG: hypothetical protein HG454_006150 [Clostridiales bacterium]|jgi:hypothetical protein|nr:hypothetical protein [Clostridiales bacterium]
MIEIYDNFFSKELVEGFFDLKIKIKFNLLRIKNLAPYMKDGKVKIYLLELEQFNKEVKDYMELYKERFHISAIKKNLEKSKFKNEELIQKYKLELEEVRKFEADNGAYPLQFNKFSEDLCKDILELERYKKDQEKLIINSIE